MLNTVFPGIIKYNLNYYSKIENNNYNTLKTKFFFA